MSLQSLIEFAPCCLIYLPHPSSSHSLLFLSPSTPPFFSLECGVRYLPWLEHACYPFSLNTAGEELINASSTENTAEVQKDLKDLNKCDTQKI